MRLCPSCLQRAVALLAMVLCMLLAVYLTPAHAKADGVWVTATGHAFVNGQADNESAKRRALGDALVNAALAGGAEVRGYSALAMGRITGDFTVMRATGKVFRYELIEARLEKTHWTVGIKALVGQAPPLKCAPKQTLVLTAETPRISASPYAPAWAAAMAEEAARDLYKMLDKHPNVSLDRILPPGETSRRPVRSAAMDYLTLTRGRPASVEGDHLFVPEFVIDTHQDGRQTYIDFRTELVFRAQSGATIRRVVERSAPMPYWAVDAWRRWAN